MLVNSLSLLFTFTSFISQLEALGVALGVWLMIELMTPKPSDFWEFLVPQSLYYYLQASWLGNLRLKDAFWPFFIVLNGTLFYIDYLIDEGDFTVASWVTMHIIMAMPLIYWTGAVWRCSDKCRVKFWSVAARFMTVAAYFDFGLRWVIMEYYPQILFNCQQMITQWGDCV
jgi:hypothetical protein